MTPLKDNSSPMTKEVRPAPDLAEESSPRLSAKAARSLNRGEDSLLTEAEIEAAEEEAYAWARRANSC
jgi:hypothetical protein